MGFAIGFNAVFCQCCLKTLCSSMRQGFLFSWVEVNAIIWFDGEWHFALLNFETILIFRASGVEMCPT